MIRDQTDGNILYIIYMISCIGKFTDFITKCLNGIYIKNRIYILNNGCQTLQSHTCVNVLILKLCIVTLSIIIKLGKYIIPNLHITIAVTAYCTIRLSTSVFFTTIIINLRTRTTRTGTMLPEIIFFSKAENSLFWNSNHLIP